MSFPWAKPYEPKHPAMRWLDRKLPLPRIVFGATGPGYPVPRNLNYFWNFGVLNGVALVIQIVTGVVLAMHYTTNSGLAFESVERIMRDVNSGWLIRYAHMNGASLSSPPSTSTCSADSIMDRTRRHARWCGCWGWSSYSC